MGKNGSTITVTHTAIYLGEYYGSGQGYYMMENTPRKTTAKGEMRSIKSGKKVELPGDYSGNVGKSWTIAVTQGVDKEETITNETSKTMSLTITMVDADNSKIRLSGAELVVREWSNQYGRYLKRSCGTMKESDDKPGVYSIEGLEVTSDNDKNGTGTVRYQIEETKAPTKAYKKKNGAWAEMDLPADSDSSVGKTWTYAIQSGRDEKDTIGK